ncbi:hypothetical protein D3C76_153240 [compost metagenome]
MQNNNKGIIVNGGEFKVNSVSIGNVTNFNQQDIQPEVNHPKFQYDVALSFAGEDRSYVEMIAKELRVKGIKVFYDEFEEITMWGKDLFVYLDHIFTNSATFCVMFISESYTKKAWCDLECNSAINRQYKKGEYILPVCLDQTVIQGITDKYKYLEAKDYSPVGLAEAINMKLTSINAESALIE